jgi:hopanoid-associated phosphorylase
MILAATGLRREARILASPDVRALTSGGRSAVLEAALSDAAPGAEAIISIGLGGALAPGFQPGDWVLGERAVWAGGEAPVDSAWLEALRRRLPAARSGVILGSETMLTDHGQKAAAHAGLGAIAVDMESHVAARVAQRFGLPFAVARVISDAADQDLPPAVKVGMRPDGGMALGPVLLAVLRSPGQIPALIGTARSAERAFRALVDGCRLLGPRLGRPDLGELPLDVA